MEPENLSTKPEDLSLKKRRTESPAPEERLPTPVSRSSSPSPSESKSTISIPTPTYPSLPMYYPSKSPSSPTEPLSYASPANWHKPTPNVYPGYHPFAYSMPYPSDIYSLYQHQISPTRSEQMSPYAQRDSSVSPPAHNMYIRNEPVSPPMMPQYLNNNNNIIKSEHYSSRSQHRYVPYSLGHHHQLIMPVDQSSLSPTSSHASYNSYLSSRRSLSPASSNPSSNDDSAISVLTEKSSNSANIQKVKIEKELISEKQNNSNNSGAPRYQCPDCGKSYSTYSGLSKHQQFHCPAAEGNQAQKTFVCKECDKPYKTLGALKMHIRTHTLPCKCNLCDKAFSRPWLLQGHIRTHTGEKPFVCKLCSRAFADRSNLRAHQQTHEDVKRFKCQTCTKSFSRLPLLNKHNETGCPGIQINGNTPVQQSHHHEEDKYMPSVLPNTNITVY